MRGTSPRHGALIALLVAGFLIRVLPVLSMWEPGSVHPFDTEDSAEYFDLASAVLAGDYAKSTGVVELHRPPGYPAFLAIGVIAHAPHGVALALQLVLSTLTIALVFLITERLAQSRRTALIAAALCAAAPVQIAWASRIMAETQLAFLVTLGAWSTLRAIDGGALRHIVIAGLSMAAAAYTKPIATYLGLVLVCLGPLLYRGAAERRRLVLVSVLSWLVMLPWAVRNGVQADYWGFSNKVDRVLSLSGPAVVRSEIEGRDFATVRAEVRVNPTTGPEFDVARRQGLTTILGAPVVWARVYFRGIARTTLGGGAMPLLEAWGHDVRATSESVFSAGSLATLRSAAANPSPFLWMTLLLWPFTALTILLPLAAFLLGRMQEPSIRVLIAVVVYFLLLSGGPWGQSRFRAPLEPLLCVITAVAASRAPWVQRPVL